MMRRAIMGAVVFLALAGCGSDGPITSENYGNVLASPAGLVLVREEHPTGWTRPDCFACHEIRNIHIVNRTGLPDDVANLAGVRAIVSNQGQASCMQCHGTNGVPMPVPTATQTATPTPDSSALVTS